MQFLTVIEALVKTDSEPGNQPARDKHVALQSPRIAAIIKSALEAEGYTVSEVNIIEARDTTKPADHPSPAVVEILNTVRLMQDHQIEQSRRYHYALMGGIR